MAHAKDLAPLRKKLYPHRLPSMSPKLRRRGTFFRNPVGTGWCMPFVGADQPVMRRSQYFFHEKKGKRPLQLQCYFTIPSFANVVSFMIAGIFLSIFTKFKWGQQLLLKVILFYKYKWKMRNRHIMWFLMCSTPSSSLEDSSAEMGRVRRAVRIQSSTSHSWGTAGRKRNLMESRMICLLTLMLWLRWIIFFLRIILPHYNATGKW